MLDIQGVYFLSRFGGGPRVTALHPCKICEEKLRMLDIRREAEKKSYQEVPDESEFTFVISRDWLKAWFDFVNSREIGRAILTSYLKKAPTQDV